MPATPHFRPSRRFLVSLMAVAGAAAWLASPASAQNALGDGRALDHNLQQGSGGRNQQSRDFAAEMRFRNSIVTGNAPGGASFRGDVGYSAPSDFRGSLGSDDLFNFQRDTLYSGLATRNIRGIDALRQQMSLTTGAPADYTGLPFSVERPGAGASVQNLRVDTPDFTINPFLNREGSLRATSSFLGAAPLEAHYFSATQDNTGRQYVIGASPLRGVVTEPLLRQMAAAGAGGALNAQLDAQLGAPTGQQGAEQQPQGGVPTLPSLPTLPDQPENPWQQVDEHNREIAEGRPGSVTDRVDSGRIDTRIQPQPATRVDTREGADDPAPVDARVSPYEALLQHYTLRQQEREAERNAQQQQPQQQPDAAPDALDDPWGLEGEGDDAGAMEREAFLERVDRLRRQMRGEGLLDDIHRAARETRERQERERRQEVTGEEPTDAPGVRSPLTPEQVAGDAPVTNTDHLASIRNRAAELLGGADPRLDSFVGEAAGQSLYTQRMNEAQRLLREGRWFDAEEVFTRALTTRRGDPLASIGRIHAQLGAGMYLSAALNLRTLMGAHPELSAVRYDESLLPDESRIDGIREALRDESNRDRPFARDAGLLLAYLGHQVGDEDLVREGFAAVDRIDEYLDEAPSPVVEALKGVWLGKSENEGN